MKYAILAAMLFANGASANEMPVLGFNGFSFMVDARKIRGGETPQTVIDRAGAVCGSVGKSAELQITEEVSDFRARFYYICL